MFKNLLLALLVLFSLSACDTKKEAKTANGTSMKCGAGKCGANMFDATSALAQKKRNILNQMREDDTRKTCVLDALNTKALYACVRSPQSGKLTLKCGLTQEKKKPAMKCAAGKCGTK